MMLPATLLLTRPRAASERFARQLTERFGELNIVISPLMEIEFLDLASFAMPDAVVFTSRNGVEAWANATFPTDMTCYCVGTATADAARAIGFEPFVSGGTVEHLIADLKEIAPNGTVLHVRGRHSRGDLTAQITRAGLKARDLVAYEQKLLPLNSEAQTLLLGGVRVIVPLFSPRSAAHFAKLGPFGPQVDLIAISKAAVQPCQGAHVAPNPDAEGMLSAISDILIA